ncbi:hypothetical protein C3L33_03044, partial [Rhododendron williamsianum]
MVILLVLGTCLEYKSVLYPIIVCRAIISSKMPAVQNTGKAQKKDSNDNFIVRNSNYGMPAQSLFPLYIILARPVSSVAVAEYSAIYRFSRACLLTNGAEGINRAQANFILPEINKLGAEVKSSSLAILFVSCAEVTNSGCAIDSGKNHIGMTSFPCKMCLRCPHSLVRKETLTSHYEESGIMTKNLVDGGLRLGSLSCTDEEKYIAFQTPIISELRFNTPQQLEVIISAEEIGAKEKSPYNSYSYNDMPASLSHIMRLVSSSPAFYYTPYFYRQKYYFLLFKHCLQISDFGCLYLSRLRTGNVIFNYRYYNNKLQRTEVTEDFSCPFCLVKCASFKGLRFHLSSSHDLFNFEFWVTEEYQAVNVSVKTEIWKPEVVADGVDPKQQTFVHCSKPLRRRKPKNIFQKAKHVRPLVLDSNFPAAINELRSNTDGLAEYLERDTSSPNATGVSSATAHSYADPECVQSLPGSNLGPPAMLQFAKTRKLSVERSDPRNRALLQKRQFFHSHRAQPMALEQVLSDRDSEDEVDDDVADFEDRRMLDDFVDVTKDEKQMMHLWNSFVRKQR